MTKKLVIIFMALALALAAVFASAALADTDKPCPWTISGIEAGKWANGNQKAGLWAHGSFPIPPGVSERPTWYVNGTNIGHSQIHFNTRFLPNSSRYLHDGSNTVTVKFLKPPYNGASNSKSFSFSWDQIGPGQHKVFK